MFESGFFISFLIALVGSSLAAWYDLKTTEIPDEISAIMASLGIFIWFTTTLNTGNPYYVILSIAVGLIFLTFGWLLYKTGQWGGGDAKLLSAIGCLLPAYFGYVAFDIFPLPLTYVLNLFIIGSIYMIIYALAVGLMNKKKVFPSFFKEVCNSLHIILGVPIVITLTLYFMAIAIFSQALLDIYMLTTIAIVFAVLVLFWKYAQTIEQHVFVRTIPVSELKEGDVILESRQWEGLTKEEVETLKRRKKRVTIKEGVRFAPAFPIALLVTFFYGNILFGILLVQGV